MEDEQRVVLLTTISSGVYNRILGKLWQGKPKILCEFMIIKMIKIHYFLNLFFLAKDIYKPVESGAQ